MRYKEQYGYEILSDDNSFLVLDEDSIPIADGEVTMGPEGFEVTLLWCGYVPLVGMQNFINSFFQKICNETFAN
jgi:hypothetical protein